MNAIKQWDTDYVAELPSLEEIDLTGNPYWTANQSFGQFQHPAIKVIKGLSLNSACEDCTFHRNTTSAESCPSMSDVGHTKQKSCTYCPQWTCRCTRRIFQHFTLLLQQNNLYFIRCRHSIEQCRRSLYENKTVNVCLEKVGNSIMFVYFAIGAVGVLLNSVEIVNILTAKCLRKNVSMMVVCNMALCDLMISTYVVLINVVHSALTYDKFQGKQHQICPFVGSLWLLGQIGTVLTSTLLTIERYRAIVSAMEPSKKLSNKQVIYCLAVTWFTAAVTVTYAVIFGFFTYNFICLPITAYPWFAHLYRYTFVLCIAGSLGYLANIPMYVHICVIVRRSRLNVGIKRESFLTKRIALLVVTNIAFVFLPLSLCMILIALGLFEDFDAGKNVNYWVTLAPVYVPLIFLDLNSCVNPLLHAYRNEEFKKSLRRWSKCLCWQRKGSNRIDILRLDVHNLEQRNKQESPRLRKQTSQLRDVKGNWVVF